MFHRLSLRPRPHPPTFPTSPPRSPISPIYQHPSGSKFKEDEVSAVLTSETGSYAASSVDELPGSRRNLRNISARLQKSHRAPLPSFHESDVQVSEIMNVPHPSPASSGTITFCPTQHSLESFTEDDRLKVNSHENARVTLLRDVAPEQSAICSELLQTSLPTGRDAIRDIMPQRNGFVKTVIESYNNHRGLIIRPDDVWLAILVQFGFFVHNNADALHSVFIGHGARAGLVIRSRGDSRVMDPASMEHQLTELIQDQIPDLTLREWIVPSFTTTTPVDRTACAMVMMGTMREYLTFNFVQRGGVPRVTLEGEKKDWEDIILRLERLKKYGIQTVAWYHLLRPVISRFAAAYDNPHSPENLDFWNKIAHHELANESQMLSGWITAFCVFNEQGQWQGNKLNQERIREHEPKKLLRPVNPFHISAPQFASVYTIRQRTPCLVLDGFPYPTINSQDIPCGYACLDVTLDDSSESLDTMLIAGSIGSQICSTEKTELFRNGMRDTVRPVTAWWYLMKRKGVDEVRGRPWSESGSLYGYRIH
ncbi:hypothetical protein PAXRUDRAFT_832777 [Paxillus rubicundulus Ve08.2h10]|uniref:Uncharacterized protein n=1 Tax=Paxillus rubicundulus Ve08.2h10 TaxID=930991 RepID=A0A0D0DIX0_9AGAM|nr:hypothetical protein PAXRUDRAFT_832777 [Paxillus rubicundulus Ve08.2h10]